MAYVKVQRKAQARIVRDGHYTIALLTAPNLGGKGSIEITKVAKYNPNDSIPKYIGKKISNKIGRKLTKEEVSNVKLLEYDPSFGVRVALTRAVKDYNRLIIAATAEANSVTTAEAAATLKATNRILAIGDVQIHDPQNTVTQDPQLPIVAEEAAQ